MPRLLVGGLLLALFFIVTINNLDADLGWHLRAGEYILTHREVPRADTFSNSMPGYEWVDHEWLTQALLAWLHDRDLWYAVIAVFTLLWFLPFAVWLGRMRKSFDIWIVGLAGLLLLGYLGVRPHMFSYLFYFLVLEACLARYVRGNRTIFFYFLPGIFLLWANMHGGFLAGLLVLALFAAGELYEKRRIAPADAAVLLLSFAATLVNPYGVGLYREAVSVAASPFLAKYINEWQSALLLPAFSASTISGMLVLLALLIMLALPVFLIIKFRKVYPLAFLLPVSFIFLGFLKTLKFGPLYLLTMIPFITFGVNLVREKIRASNFAFLKAFKIGLFAFLVIFAASMFATPSRAGGYPEQAARVLQVYQEAGLVGNLFNVYDWGGYLLREVPRMKVFIDGRMPHWRDKTGYSAMADYVTVMYPEKDEWPWEEVFRRKGITTAILKNVSCAPAPEYARKIAKFLPKFSRKAAAPCRLEEMLKAKNWQVIHEDPVAIIFHVPK